MVGFWLGLTPHPPPACYPDLLGREYATNFFFDRYDNPVIPGRLPSLFHVKHPSQGRMIVTGRNGHPRPRGSTEQGVTGGT